jgi:exonuclease SbcD
MRLLHTADWHLGRALHRVPLLDAQRAVVDHLVGLAREERVDAILLAGDVFDRALPPVEAVRVAGDALRRLAEVAPVVVISGNHDSAGRLGFAAELIAAGGVHLRTEPTTSGDPLVLEDEHGPVAIYGIPYLDPDLARGPLGVEERSHDAVLGAAMELVRRDLAGREGARAVVVAHAFVQGGEASESERDISIGGAETVPASIFSGADYVALGHLHRPHAVGGSGRPAGPAAASGGPEAAADDRDATTAGAADEGDAPGASATPARPSAIAPTPADAVSLDAQAELGGLFALPLDDAPSPDPGPGRAADVQAAAADGVPAAGDEAAEVGGAGAAAPEPSPDPPGAVRYAGSPLPYSFTEADAAKSTAIVDLAADGTSTVRFVPVPAPFRLVRLRGTLEELLADEALAAHESADSWVEVVLTDPLLPARPMERLRARFPQVLVLQHAPEGELSPATVARDRIRGRTDLQVLEAFVADVRGEAPGEDEIPLLQGAAEAAHRGEDDG